MKGDPVQDDKSPNPFDRVHARLDDIKDDLGKVRSEIAEIKAACKPCRQQLESHQKVLHGNGKGGLAARMEVVETGRVDTLSVKSVCILLGAVGTLTAAVSAAVASLVGGGTP